MKSVKKKATVLAAEPVFTTLRGQVAKLRATHRAELDEMAERTRIERAAFVQHIHTEVTKRIAPAVAQLLADIRAERAQMAARTQKERQQFVEQVRAWVG